MGLITETNEQYYAGSQRFLSTSAAVNQKFTATFDTDLVLGSSSPSETNYALNNFKLYTAAPGVLTYTEYTNAFSLAGNVVTIAASIPVNTSVVIQLKKLDGGS